MAPLIVLIASALIFRGIGALGVAYFAAWAAASRYALSVMLLFTAAAHFTKMKQDLIRMVPACVPKPQAMVFFTGLCEIAGAVGLLIPATQRAAGFALIVFFLAVFSANVHAANAGVTIRGRAATALWLRVPMQILFIAIAWWATR
jgi:uncharacterized membrane protein